MSSPKALSAKVHAEENEAQSNAEVMMWEVRIFVVQDEDAGLMCRTDYRRCRLQRLIERQTILLL